MKRLLVITIVGLMLLAVAALAANAAAGERMLKIIFTDPQGKPIPKFDLNRFCCRDLNDEPLTSKVTITDGEASIEMPTQPMQVSVMLKVPGFGEVAVYADNMGRGYTKPATIDFVSDAAYTRHHRVSCRLLAEIVAGGVSMPDSFREKLASAGKAPPYDSLAVTLALGEELTMASARHRIAQLKGPRKGFLFGCDSFGYPARGPLYQQRYKELFNYGTTNLYLTHYAPSETQRDYSRTDAETNWLLSMGMTAKTCPPFYLAGGVLPAWLKQKPWSEGRKFCHDLVMETTKRYAGKCAFCEITNEATMSNGLGLSTAEILDMTEIASKAAREGDPNVGRIINSAHLWGDFAARPDKLGRPRLSPYAYVRECIKAKIPFEIVGLQMYYPEYDLFEIDRMLDRYAALGKQIHITEMGCSSAPGVDPNAQRKAFSAGWHGPWTEDMQADWVVSVYTLFYSKPYIQAISWWDLADAVSFWPYGGMCRGDLSPKPAYTRLQNLLAGWGFKVGGGP